MRKLTIASIVLIGLIAIYLGGPHPSTPVYNPSLPQVSDTGIGLERYVATMEQPHHLKTDNEARIVWANDSLKNTTEYAIVY
ncbi:MAG: alpha/beta hydrolase, partial [Sediminibacterium sp.]|nr:alpha/beta hydrolase [Sediminibacterium sp.]